MAIETLDDTIEQLVGPTRVPDTELMCSTGCGCPHEEWEYQGAVIALHQDAGLPVQVCVLIDEGEEFDLPDAPTFESARAQARRWIDTAMAASGGEEK